MNEKYELLCNKKYELLCKLTIETIEMQGQIYDFSPNGLYTQPDLFSIAYKLSDILGDILKARKAMMEEETA